MKTLTAALLLLPLLASASERRAYQISIKYFEDGKLVSSPRVVTFENQKAEVADQETHTANGHFIEVLPLRWDGPNSDNQVELRFAIGKIIRGVKKETARPMIVALEGEEASIEISGKNNDGSPEPGSFKVAVTATRVD